MYFIKLLVNYVQNVLTANKNILNKMVEEVLWSGHIWLPSELGYSLVFNDVTADTCSRMTFVEHRAILSAQIQSKMTGRHLTV